MLKKNQKLIQDYYQISIDFGRFRGTERAFKWEYDTNVHQLRDPMNWRDVDARNDGIQRSLAGKGGWGGGGGREGEIIIFLLTGLTERERGVGAV